MVTASRIGRLVDRTFVGVLCAGSALLAACAGFGPRTVRAYSGSSRPKEEVGTVDVKRYLRGNFVYSSVDGGPLHVPYTFFKHSITYLAFTPGQHNIGLTPYTSATSFAGTTRVTTYSTAGAEIRATFTVEAGKHYALVGPPLAVIELAACQGEVESTTAHPCYAP